MTTTKVPRSRQRKAERATPAVQDCTAALDGRDAWAHDALKHEADVFRSMVCHAREAEGYSWKEISQRTGIPEYALRVLCRETVGARPSMDRQSGR